MPLSRKSVRGDGLDEETLFAVAQQGFRVVIANCGDVNYEEVAILNGDQINLDLRTRGRLHYGTFEECVHCRRRILPTSSISKPNVLKPCT